MVAVTQIGYTFTLVTNRKLLKSVEYVAAINGGDGFPTSMVQIHFIRASWKHGLLSNEHTGNTTSANTWAFSVTAQLR